MKKYIGKPYEKYNCLDLVKEFYKDNFDIKLSNYFEGPQVPSSEEVEALIISNKGSFCTVLGEPEFGDIVSIKLYGIECHIGVCLGDGKFLHSTKKIGSNMDTLSRYSSMIAGYYRHKETT